MEVGGAKVTFENGLDVEGRAKVKLRNLWRVERNLRGPRETTQFAGLFLIMSACLRAASEEFEPVNKPLVAVGMIDDLNCRVARIVSVNWDGCHSVSL